MGLLEPFATVFNYVYRTFVFFFFFFGGGGVYSISRLYYYSIKSDDVIPRLAANLKAM